MILLDVAGTPVVVNLPDSTADVVRVNGVVYRFRGIDGASGQRVYQAGG